MIKMKIHWNQFGNCEPILSKEFRKGTLSKLKIKLLCIKETLITYGRDNYFKMIFKNLIEK